MKIFQYKDKLNILSIVKNIFINLTLMNILHSTKSQQVFGSLQHYRPHNWTKLASKILKQLTMPSTTNQSQASNSTICDNSKEGVRSAWTQLPIIQMMLIPTLIYLLFKPMSFWVRAPTTMSTQLVAWSWWWQTKSHSVCEWPPDGGFSLCGTQRGLRISRAKHNTKAPPPKVTTPDTIWRKEKLVCRPPAPARHHHHHVSETALKGSGPGGCCTKKRNSSITGI